MMSFRLMPNPYSPTDMAVMAARARGERASSSRSGPPPAAAARSSTSAAALLTAVNASAIRVSCSTVSRRWERNPNIGREGSSAAGDGQTALPAGTAGRTVPA